MVTTPHRLKKFKFIKWICFIVACWFLPFAASGQTFSLTPYPFLGAGGTVSNGLFTVEGSFGQPDATLKTLAGGSFATRGGFWSADFLEDLTPPGELNVAL